MQNHKLIREIDFAFRRVRRLGKSWGFIPLNWLPEGCEVHFTCRDSLPPLEPDMINGGVETHITRLAEGSYSLVIFQYPTLLFQHRDTTLQIKPWYGFLSPGSEFNANYDKGDTTYRLNSGRIKKVSIPGTKYVLTEEDGKERKKPKPFYRRPKRMGYQPLRNRKGS